MNPFERLAAVKQADSVNRYIDEFVTQAARIPTLLDIHSLGFFLNGLREEKWVCF